MKWPKLVCACGFALAAAASADDLRERLAESLRGAAPSAQALRTALDAAWRADAWHEGLRLAQSVELFHPDERSLDGVVARAYWRAGRVADAERVLANLRPGAADEDALLVRVQIELARGQRSAARRFGAALEERGLDRAPELYTLLTVRLLDDEMQGLPALLRKAIELTDAKNGYPDVLLADAMQGMPEFFDGIGPAPINEVVAFGEAAMPVLTGFNLPYCQALINGQGPFTFIVDTGGSISLSLDQAAAERVGLKSYGTALVRGVSGTQDSEQLLVDELVIGGIRCERVMTRSFEMPAVLAAVADGILGTGIFDEAQMTMDFANSALRVAASGTEVQRGRPVECRVIGDAKIMAISFVQGRGGLALLDTGADVVAVSPHLASRLFPDADPLRVDAAAGVGVGAGGDVGVSLIPGVDVELAGRRFEAYSGIGLEVLDSLLSPVLGVQTDLLVGMPMFRQMDSFTIDFPQAKLWVKWLD